LTEWI